MALNRRHKAILFLTLVASGCGLLLGAELKETLGFILLGGACAWAIGSDAFSKAYAGVKGTSGKFYFWIRLPLVMAFAGGVLGLVLLYGRANPLLVVASMCVIGIFLEPLTPLPTQNVWLRVPLILVAIAAFFAGFAGIISTDLITSNEFAERFGQLAITGLLSLAAGFVWLSKGWRLVMRGISSTPHFDSIEPANLTRTPWGLYVSLFFGLSVLTMWLGLLAWSASSNWRYAPEKLVSSKDNNIFVQFVFVILMAFWPYRSWQKITNEEPNVDRKYLRRHRRVSAFAGMIFVIIVSLATTYGIQNGIDRRTREKVEIVAKALAAAGGKIGAVKDRNLQTTGDYIEAYSEIESLLPDFETKLNECTVVYEDARKIDESRGLINTQFFYRTYRPDLWKDNFALLDLVRQVDLLTRREVLTIREMAALPAGEQGDFWDQKFKPLLVEQDGLRTQIESAAAKFQSPSN